MHRDVARRHRPHLDQKQVQARGRDRGVGWDGGEIESHHPAAQRVGRFISPPRENKDALAVGERAGRTLIEGVVLGCWEGIGQGNTAHGREKEKDGEPFRDGSDRMMHGKKNGRSSFLPTHAADEPEKVSEEKATVEGRMLNTQCGMTKGGATA